LRIQAKNCWFEPLSISQKGRTPKGAAKLRLLKHLLLVAVNRAVDPHLLRLAASMTDQRLRTGNAATIAKDEPPADFPAAAVISADDLGICGSADQQRSRD
jgi:hypothetical protein